MSRSPFVVTLIVCGALLGWVYSSQEGGGGDNPAAPPAGVGAPERLFGFPDPRGIVLELHEHPDRGCPAALFRSESPEFVLWDDGSVVFRDSTFDYKRGRVSRVTAERWRRTFRAHSQRSEAVACEAAAREPAAVKSVRLWGRVDGQGRSIEIAGLGSGSHADECPECRSLRPLAWLLGDIFRQRYQGEDGEVLSDLPVEVHVEFRSCGCRNHPDIVRVSKEWPLPGRKPSEICGRGSARLLLEDPAQIRALGEAISRSAAVLDGEEIYTVFMRPLLDLSPRAAGPLARR
jgi:hypothetical protein